MMKRKKQNLKKKYDAKNNTELLKKIERSRYATSTKLRDLRQLKKSLKDKPRLFKKLNSLLQQTNENYRVQKSFKDVASKWKVSYEELSNTWRYPVYVDTRTNRQVNKGKTVTFGFKTSDLRGVRTKQDLIDLCQEMFQHGLAINAARYGVSTKNIEKMKVKNIDSIVVNTSMTNLKFEEIIA